jgi:predicted ArsR family transcriptional regulator
VFDRYNVVDEEDLSLFRTVLADDVSVERVEHLLRGDGRCAFRIADRADAAPVGEAR